MQPAPATKSAMQLFIQGGRMCGQRIDFLHADTILFVVGEKILFVGRNNHICWRDNHICWRDNHICWRDSHISWRYCLERQSYCLERQSYLLERQSYLRQHASPLVLINLANMSRWFCGIHHCDYTTKRQHLVTHSTPHQLLICGCNQCKCGQ